MNSRGFTLIELLIVIAIIGILTAIGTFQFAEYSKKSAIESQTRQLYTDIMEQRSKALFEKRNRGVKVTASSFSLYSSASDDNPRTLIGNPFATTTLKYPITSNNNYNDIIIDTGGMIDTVSNQSICVTETNTASIDSIVISETRIRIGKKEGIDCASGNIDAK